MSVAKRRRGRPAWGSSLSNGTGARTQMSPRLCAPNPACQESRLATGQGHTLPRKRLPSVPACLLSRVPHRGVLQESNPPPPPQTGGASATINSPGRILPWGGRLREGRQEGQGDQSPRQARLGRALQDSLCQLPVSPSSGSDGREESCRLLAQRAGRSPRLKAAGGQPPGRAQPLRGFKRSGRHWGWATEAAWGWKDTDKSWGYQEAAQSHK